MNTAFKQDAVLILTTARDVLALPGKWTTDELARGDNDRPAEIGTACATKFCSLGAMMEAQKALQLSRIALDLAENVLNKMVEDDESYINFVEFNDSQKTVKPVLKLFDKAVEYLCTHKGSI